MSKIKSVCSKCLADTINPLRCSKCKMSIYCSRKCQKEDWSIHKADCINRGIEPLLAEEIWKQISNHDTLHFIVEGLLAWYPNAAIVCDVVPTQCPDEHLCRLTTMHREDFSEMRKLGRNSHLDDTVYKDYRGAVYNICHDIDATPILSTVGMYKLTHGAETISKLKEKGFNFAEKPPLWMIIKIK